MGKWDNLRFDRWTPLCPHSLPYRLYKSYDNDLMGMITSFESAKGYTYSHLYKDGAVWDSKAYDYGLMKDNQTRTVREWSENYEEFANWLRLSLLLSSCSYFENYISAIVKECIDSDPGLLISAPHVIDGIKYKKHGISLRNDEVELKIISCTKGTWQSRIENLSRLFGRLPESMVNSISELESIRIIRNDLAHAFGRDIKESQDYFRAIKSPIRRLSVKRFNKFHTLLNQIVQDFDFQVNQNHIGNYELILQYHNLYDSIKDLGKGYKVQELKKSLLLEKNTGCSKEFCRGVIVYYEHL